MSALIAAGLAVAILNGVSTAQAPPDQQSQSEKASRKSSARVPLDHLRSARSVLNEVERDALKPDAVKKVNEVKTRLAALEASYRSHGRKTMSTQETASGSTRVRIGQQGTWTSQVPDVDKLLGELVDPRAAMARDEDRNEAIKRKLAAVRSHLAAFATGASGTSGPGR